MTKNSGEGKPRRWRKWLMSLLIVALVLVSARAALPVWLRSYVNRNIDKSPVYDGKIGEVELALWRGGYIIKDVRINKTTGVVPVPFFAARRVHMVIEWGALWHGKVVGQVVMDDPEMNFVDAEDQASTQTGAEGPWLDIIKSLFPFKINSAVVHNGAIHFRAFDKDPPVNVYLSKIEGRIDNLTNIFDDTTPLISTVEATGLAMGQGKFEYKMKLDPFSYRPTFDLGVRLVGLDVQKVNSLTQAYGKFDFEDGYFDLVLELTSREGDVDGYVKPLFRNLRVLDLAQDARGGDPLQVFWESLVELTAQLFKNQRRDQFGTLIPLAGSVNSGGARANILATVGNVLRNAFVRAYLPRFEGGIQETGLTFGPPEPWDGIAEER